MPAVGVTRLKGPIWVAYTQKDGKHYATALQFDLVGAGTTRKKAFRALQGVFLNYIEAFLDKPGKTRFLFPSEPEEWNNSDVEFYDVMIIVRYRKRKTPLPPCTDIKGLKPFRGDIEGIQFDKAA